MYLLSSLFVLSVAVAAPAEEFEACRPATRFTTAPWWTSRLGETRDRILSAKGACYDLVMVGDSITHHWENKANGASVYPKLQKKYKVLNLGNGGDRTQCVLSHGRSERQSVRAVAGVSDLAEAVRTAQVLSSAQLAGCVFEFARADEAERLQWCKTVFAAETGVRKTLRLTLVTPVGFALNKHAGIVQNVVALNDRFRE